jgi:hypothetical protein
LEQNLRREVTDQCDLQEYVKAQITEMERFKWSLGTQLGYDPLRDRSLNEIYTEWIQKYAAAFRGCWEEKNRGKTFSVSPDASKPFTCS